MTQPRAPSPKPPQPCPEAYEWASAVEIINDYKYKSIADAYKDGWQFEGGAFRRIPKNDIVSENG